MKILQRAAQSGILPAQTLVGQLLYFKGEGPAAQQQGLHYLEHASQSGDPQAQFILADSYRHSKLVHRAIDEKKALYWYQQAAKQQNKMACLRLAEAYEKGLLGLNKDPAMAHHWRETMERQ